MTARKIVNADGDVSVELTQDSTQTIHFDCADEVDADELVDALNFNTHGYWVEPEAK
jgi:hypothetical protein